MKYIDIDKYKNSVTYRSAIFGRLMVLSMIDGIDGLTKEKQEELRELTEILKKGV